MDTVTRDLRYALRQLQRAPGFTAIAITTLALAIGATTAVFSIVYAVLIKPLPFKEPAGLVRVASMTTSSKGRDDWILPLSTPDYIDYRDQSTSFVGMAPLANYSVNLTGTGGQPMRLELSSVGDRFFELLGVSAQRGRTFARGEDSVGAPRVVVLSDALWRNRFGADPDVLGRSISIDGVPYTVIGVAPRKFTYPDHPDGWIPMQWEPWQLQADNRQSRSFFALARVKRGVPIEHAREEIASIGKRLELTYPQFNTHFAGTIQPLRDQLVGDVRPALWAMLGAVGFVLLIACANVANLQLVRAASRASEIAVRTALGAGRGILVRQLVTESVVLSAAGALAGAALATWIVAAVVAVGPPLPRLDEVVVDTRMLLFAVVVALATGVLFGLVPAAHASRTDLAQMLRDGPRGSQRGVASRTRGALVVGELALAVVLLAGAGLLIQSFVRLTRVDPGFRVDHLTTFNLALPEVKYPYDRHKRAFVGALTQRLTMLPGATDVAVSMYRPLVESRIRTTFSVHGRPEAGPGNEPLTNFDPVSPSYFHALGMRLVRGRLFTEDENRHGVPPVVVVNEELVRRYFPNEDPIGKYVTFNILHDTAATGTDLKSEGTIIGVVASAKQIGLSSVFYPMSYVPFGTLPTSRMTVLVRSTSDPAMIVRGAVGQVRVIDGDLPVYDLQSMEQAMSASVAQPRFYTQLLGAFSLLALVLAALGIYGVISFAVGQRTRELGIRIALGAAQQRIIALVLGQGLWLTVSGVVAGLIGAALLTRVLSSLLFGVAAFDALTFGVVALILAAVALLATWIPARRASRIDPVIAMRAE